MRWLNQLQNRLRMLFRRAKAADQLDNELRFHLDQQVAENRAAGMNEQEARRKAALTFGNPGQIREETRSNWAFAGIERLLRDLRFGARTLFRSPGFAIVSIIVMALGLGATTSLFTIVRSVLLRPLPFRETSQLYMLYEHFRESASGAAEGYNLVAPGDYLDWRAQTHAFADMAAMRGYGGIISGVHSELPEVVQSAAGSANLFSLLGVTPIYGRTFTEAEDQPNGTPVVLLTWSIFQRRFSGDRSIIGKQVHLDTIPTTVIGVLPPSFSFPDARDQIWLPYAQTFTLDQYHIHDGHQSLVVARLKPGANLQSATGEISALQFQIHLANANKPVAEDVWSRPIMDSFVKDARTPLFILLGAVSCMLLIACLNLSNLLVARSAARRKEVAIRAVLGGSRLTLIREQLTESLLICLTGGLLGLLLSLASTHWLATHWRNLPRADSVHADPTVFGFALALVVVTALISGLVPALASTGKNSLAALQDGGRSISGSAARGRLRKVMLVAEIAITVTLLIAAGLLFRSFLHLRTADLGCRVDHVITMKYGLPTIQYDTREKVLRFHQSLLERVRSIPGVLGAGLVATPPGAGPTGDRVFTILERPAPSYTLQYDATTLTADPEYFKVMHIPLLRGRVFTDHERLLNDHYIVVSKRFVDKFLPNDEPLGKHVLDGWDDKPGSYEIIGVVGDTIEDVTKPAEATIYYPIFSGIPYRTSEATIVAHTAVDPLSMSLPIQQQISALEPELPVYNALTMDQILDKTTAGQAFSADLLLAFAALSLLLAGVGLYGVLSYLVTQRTSEIGVRIALGAQRDSVLRLMLFDGLRPALLGLALGLAVSLATVRLLRSMLFGIQPFDATTFLVVSGLLLFVSAFACLLPAWRASRLDPMQALRTE